MGRGSRRAGVSEGVPDLAWFFCEAPGAVSGLRSSWAMIDGPGPVGGVPGSAVVPAHRLDAARRESDIASRLERLSAEDRAVLALAHARECPWPVQAAEDRKGRDYRATLWAGVVRRHGRQVAALLPTTRPAQEAFLALVVKAQNAPDERMVVLSRPVPAATFDALVDEAFGIPETIERIKPDEIVNGRLLTVWRRGEDPRTKLAALLSRGFPDWLYSPAREDDHADVLREAAADARLALRRALGAWEGVAPQPDADGRLRRSGRRRGAAELGLVRPTEELELFAPAWEAVAAE